MVWYNGGFFFPEKVTNVLMFSKFTFFKGYSKDTLQWATVTPTLRGCGWRTALSHTARPCLEAMNILYEQKGRRHSRYSSGLFMHSH